MIEHLLQNETLFITQINRRHASTCEIERLYYTVREQYTFLILNFVSVKKKVTPLQIT